ncbi:hypothetical protein CTEN210_18433 [Chaetoceros tenuissimus]|uniref:Helicase-associated domain-containing protein n=1 Tax=Chaetoceros tenuissimus TaxID=426638 RepID=A0AAD3DDH3_9STRA|nr:hypothetical protein CTEN210_18433 [Chaetoceros tenuissimus]
MGFQWECSKFLPFDLRITKLQQFKEKHGHCNVPWKYEDDPSLGNWVSDMRYSYKQIRLGKTPRYNLTQARIDKLEEIGFQWQLSKNLSFEVQMTKLQQFKEKQGHCNVPRRYEDDPSLGNWVAYMRQAYKQIQLDKKPRNSLTEAKIKQLEEMGFQWQLKKFRV